jgi:hypothetical protein
VNFSISSSDVVHLARSRTSEPRIFLASAALTALLVLIALWTLTSSFREGFLAPEYGMWMAKRDLVQSCRFAPTIVQGDSRMVAGVMPEKLGDATNLALGGATPIEMYYTALHASSCPNPPQRVVLSFSPAQLMNTQYFWPRTALFGYLSYDELEQVRREARSVGDKALYSAPNVGDFDAMLTNWLYAHHFPSYYMSSIINGRVIGRLSAYHKIQQEMAETRGQHLYGQANSVHATAEEADMAQFIASPLLDAYFARLLALYEKSGTQVYYIAAPWNQATYDRLQPGFTDQLGRYLEGLARRFPNLHVLVPYTHMDDEYYGDEYHLNARGAAIFSDQVAARLDQAVAEVPKSATMSK